MSGVEPGRHAAAGADPAAEGAVALAHALEALGVRCRIEARGRLALLVAEDVRPLVDPATRRRVAALGAAHGFSHVALELDLPPDDREALRSA